ncbi:MAG: MMPL family transporter, partial [SAR324 cluster bacterium]|nr:MMPL family transporter [SAR324 cluster bacterium]
SFLLAVGVGYSVHLLVIFYRHLRDQGNKREAIGYALGHSGLAILITSPTTAGGLLSFSTVKVAPVSDLGIFGAAGGVDMCQFYPDPASRFVGFDSFFF